MFSTKEIKDVVHTFPIRDRNISNSVIDDGLIPSESKDGFVQVQTLQGALKNAIEDGKIISNASRLLLFNNWKKQQSINSSF